MTRNYDQRAGALIASEVLLRQHPKRIQPGLLFACLFFAWVAPTQSAAPDKSGVKPSVISLPSGAGSIEGLGESFEPQLNTGGSSYGVSISVPPGRAGLAPSIRLGYNSYSGNSICGIGWSLDFTMIKRQADKGFPEYDSGDTFVFGGEELVPLNNAGQDWRCENERSFQRLRRIDSDGDGAPDAWEITERNGTRHTLGRFRGQNNRWSAVEHPEKASVQAFDRTYSWMLDSTTDLHGNRIEYEYIRGNGVLYPSRITYGHLAENFHEVTFQYQDRPDAFDDYRPTFSARLDRRLTRIEVRSQGKPVRAYNFSYSYEQGDLLPAEVALQSTYLDLGVTLLKRVVQVDRSGSDANFLPPLIFTYSGLDLTKAEQRAFTAAPELDLAEPNGRVQLADLDGDALPDLFATTSEGAGKVQRVALNRGESRLSGQPKLTFAPAKLVLGSSPVDLAEPNTVVHDPKGKGLVDMSCLMDEGGNKRLETFGNRARLDVVDEDRLGFSQENLEATILPNPPAFVTYSAAGTRQMDVNFDKRGDFVNLEPGFGAMKVNTFFIERGGRWVAGESTLPPSYPLANTFQGPDGQPNPCVHLADMNGDRMLDLVCLAPSPSATGQRIRVSYWPLCGRGRYADERSMPTADTDTFEILNADLKDVFIDDITGDGLADILVLDGSGPETVLTLRVNIAGQRWSPPYARSGLPRYAPRDQAQPTIVRLADLNANGSLDLLFRNTAPQDTWAYFDLLPQGAPSLMTGIDNGLGKRTAIVYGSAAEDEQLAREAGHPWRTYAPIPLQVIRQIRSSCGVDLNGDGEEDTIVMEFRYRDPYYDGFEREFRGFAFAQRVDYGDDFLFDPVTGLMKVSGGWDTSRTPTGQRGGPSLVARYRFLTGAADQQDNDDYGGQNPPPNRQIDEFTEVGGGEQEALKGLQLVEEKVDPVVLHSASDGAFDAGCAAAAAATTPGDQSTLTPDAYVYTRMRQNWTIRRLYRPVEPIPYLADQNADGVVEDYRSAPAVPVPEGRFGPAGTTVVAGNRHSVSFVFSSEQITEFYEANGLLSAALGYAQAPVARTTKILNHDDYGNQTIVRELGLQDPPFDDERVTTTTYAHGGNALSLWIVDKPDTISITDENGAFVAKQVHFYDGEAFVGTQGQIHNRALLHRTAEHIDATRSLNATRASFDAFGNTVETRDGVGNRRLNAWDLAFQTYPISETIVVGGGAPNLIMTAAYDLGFGVITSSTDFNGNNTSYAYDSFARPVNIVRPGDTVAFPTLAFDYQPADPGRGRAFVYDATGKLTVTSVPLGAVSRVTTRQRETAGQAGEYVTAAYTDGSGRKLATVEEGESVGQWIVKEASGYNLRGQPQSKWLPFQATSSDLPQFPTLWPSGRPPAADGVSPAVVATDLFYDPVGREIRAVAPPEDWGGVRYGNATHYLPLQKRLFDEEDLKVGSPYLGTPHVQFADGLGRLIAVEETAQLTDTGTPGPLARWRSEYTYDLNDQLIRIRDSQGNVKSIAADALKRVTRIDDPDRGRMTFIYDDASNLSETVDAKGQKIVYTYDGANRIKSEDYQDGGPRSPDVEYFYDVPQTGLDLGDGTVGTANNTRAQLAYIRDLAGESHFSYDARGRSEWELKRIPDAVHGQLMSFQTRFQYDTADRLAILTYPDGDQITQEYGARNLLTRIHGVNLGDVVASVAFRPSGQFRQINYGNGVISSYTYDPRLRPISLVTTNRQRESLVHFEYAYDTASNLDRINDGRNLTGLPDAAKRFNHQVFSYDDLYRLTRVEYPVFGGNGTNHISYRYDRIGNLVSQTSDLAQQENGLAVADIGTMESGGTPGRNNRAGRQPNDPPGPHALTSITQPSTLNPQPRVYSYDDNGNMTTVDGLACEWDFKDRLVAVEDAQMRAVYTYDHTDRRITKTVHWKHPGPGQEGRISPLNPAWRMTTTHYVNRYFEVREHDTLVKYVWQGQTRVARVTASLGSNLRVQRVRLSPGWNAVSLSVGGSFPVLDPASNPNLGASAYWSGNASENGLSPVTASTPLAPGALVWIFALHDLTLTLSGNGGPLGLPVLTGTSQFVGNVFAEPLALNQVFPPSSYLALFDTLSSQWTHRFPGGISLAGLNDAPGFLLPGKVLWTTGGTGPVGQQLTTLQARFYHQDHLGSTSVISDREGAVVEETANFPFGSVRNSFRRDTAIAADPYGFTQKEKDVESGLLYFEARFLAANLGRFTRVDPAAMALKPEWLMDPQLLNPYSYALNSPTKLVDPAGRERQPSIMLNFKDVGGGAIADAKYSYFTPMTGAKAWAAEKMLGQRPMMPVDVKTIYWAKIEVFKNANDQTAIIDKTIPIYDGRGGFDTSGILLYNEFPDKGFLKVTLLETKFETGYVERNVYKQPIASGTTLYSRKEGEDLMFNVQRGEFGNTYKEQSRGSSVSVGAQIQGGPATVGVGIESSESTTTGTAIPTAGSGLNVEQK